MPTKTTNHSVRPKKSWGQNFLHNEAILARIADSLDAKPDTTVIELGAGKGALTKHLLERQYKVIAIERDRQLVPLLEEKFVSDKIKIHAANAATLNYGEFCTEEQKQVHVIGNLPYHLSSRILVSLSDAYPHVAEAVVLVQKEVAERLCAGPGTKIYGLLSVLVQRSFQTRMLFPVKPEAFFPKPKVDSALVHLRQQDRIYDINLDAALKSCAKAAFSSRRKTLVNSIAGGLRQSNTNIRQAIEQSGIDPQLRAETLSLAEFVSITKHLLDLGIINMETPNG